MNAPHPSLDVKAATGPAGGGDWARTAADGLRLAASPSFALMALLTVALGRGGMDRFCSAPPGASPLGGMALMYVLMSVFHSASWLKLIARKP